MPTTLPGWGDSTHMVPMAHGGGGSSWGPSAQEDGRIHRGLPGPSPRLLMAELEPGTQALSWEPPRLRSWTQAGALPPQPGAGRSPVGARAQQGVVAAPCHRGAAGIVADTEDPELVAGLAARVECSVGPSV